MSASLAAFGFVPQCGETCGDKEFNKEKEIIQNAVNKIVKMIQMNFLTGPKEIFNILNQVLTNEQTKQLIITILSQYAEIFKNMDKLGNCYIDNCDHESKKIILDILTFVLNVIKLFKDKEVSKIIKNLNYEKNLQELHGKLAKLA